MSALSSVKTTSSGLVYCLSLLLLSWQCLSAHAGQPYSEVEAAEIMEQAYRAYHGRQDVVGAMSLYRSLAERGHPQAQTRLAYILDLGEMDEEAIEWYRKAAKAGDPEAQLYLGQHLMSSGEEERASDLWLLSARQQYIPAMLVIADYYKRRGDGPNAIEWWTRAAELGNETAMRELVEAYEIGIAGIAPDNKEQERWRKTRESALSTTSNN